MYADYQWQEGLDSGLANLTNSLHFFMYPALLALKRNPFQGMKLLPSLLP
jgi:hypothetical protein